MVFYKNPDMKEVIIKFENEKQGPIVREYFEGHDNLWYRFKERIHNKCIILEKDDMKSIEDSINTFYKLNGINKNNEVKKEEDTKKYNLKYFKNHELLEKVAEELEKGETEKELPIKDITKETPLFDSKELLKLCVGNKHYVTLSTESIYNSIINIKYELEGLPTSNISIPVLPSCNLIERIVATVKNYEKDNNINILPEFLTSGKYTKFVRSIELLKQFNTYMKDTIVSSIELNPIYNDSTKVDSKVFYLDIKVTRKVQDTEVTNGYVLMRDLLPEVKPLMHHYPFEKLYMSSLYRYDPDKKININNSNSLKDDMESLVSSDNFSTNMCFGKICSELCKCLGKELTEMVNPEYHIGSILAMVYGDKVQIVYDTDVLNQLNETQQREVYRPFIKEIIDVCNNEYCDYLKTLGRFSKLDQVKSSIAYNFRNLLAELDNRLITHTLFSEADIMLITECEALNNSEDYKSIEVTLSTDMTKRLTQVVSLRDNLSFFMKLKAKSGETTMVVMEVLLTKDGPIISKIISNKDYKDTTKFSSVQDNLQMLLGYYLYGLLEFLGKILYIYNLLNGDACEVQYINIAKDSETIYNVADLAYEPAESVGDAYVEHIKKLYDKEESNKKLKGEE